MATLADDFDSFMITEQRSRKRRFRKDPTILSYCECLWDRLMDFPSIKKRRQLENEFIDFLEESKESILEWRYPAQTTFYSTGGGSLLHVSVKFRMWGLTEWLLLRGLSPDITNNERFTALHYAAYHNECDIVELLLKYNADPDIIDDNLETPIFMTHDIPIIRMLLAKNANIEIRNRKGYTVLIDSHDRHSTNKIAVLEEAGARLDNDQQGDTDIHNLSMQGMKFITEKILHLKLTAYIAEQVGKKRIL